MLLSKTCTGSIRTKLILFIVVPIVLFFLFGMFLTIAKISSNAEKQLSTQVITQARNYAAILDAEFNAIASLARINAGFIEDNVVFESGVLFSVLSNTVKNTDVVHGAGFIFDDANKNSYLSSMFYVYKDQTNANNLKQVESKDNGLINQGQWYLNVKRENKAIWSEPYIAENLGKTLKATVAIPFYKESAFLGVSIIDIDLNQLQKHSGLETLTEEAFVISSKEGRFITHPNPDFIMHQKLGDDAPEVSDADLMLLSNEMKSGKSGKIRVEKLSPDIDEPFWVFYAPINSTAWSFATGLPEREILAFTRSQIRYGLIGITLIVLFSIACVMIVANSLTRPLEALTDAVEKLGHGDLSINLKDISTHDEIGQLSKAFNKMTLQLRQHIDELKKQYAARDAVEHELRIARDIQSSLIPSTFPAFPDYDEFDLHAINHPASHMAGDFFDFFLLDSCRLIIVIADVSGKGTGPAMLMAVSRTHIRNLASKGEGPAAILTELNKLLIQDRDQPMFVTVFVAEYNIRSGELCYANGGHVPPYLINKVGIVGQFGEPTGTIVGMLEDAEYSEKNITLKDSETMVLFTDGIVEARLPDGKFFGEQHFMTFLSASADMGLVDLCDSALATVKAYQANKLSDDVTMLVLRKLNKSIT